MANDYQQMMEAVQAVQQGVTNVGNIAIGGEMNKKAVEMAKRQMKWANEQREAQNQWNLEMWNKANEFNVNEWNREFEVQNQYNSPAAQAQRYKDAGFSPLAVLNGGQVSSQGGISSSPSAGASNPTSASLPNMQNPLHGVDPLAISKAFNAFKATELQGEQIQNQRELINAQKLKLEAESKSIDLFRNEQFELLGAQVRVSQGMFAESQAKVKQLMSEITKIETEVKQMFQFMRESGANISLKDAQRLAIYKRLPFECKQLVASAFYQNESAWDLQDTRPSRIYESQQRGFGQYISNKMQSDYYNSNLYKSDLENRSNILKYQKENAKWHSKETERQHKYNERFEIKSDFNINVINGMHVLNSVAEPVSKFFQGYMQYSVGRAQQLRANPVSVPNGALQQQQVAMPEMYY